MSRHPSGRTLRAFDHSETGPGSGSRTSRHLETCDRCRRRLATIRAIRAVAAEEESEEPSDLWPSIRERVERGEAVLLPPANRSEAPRRRLGTRIPRPVATAATVLLLAAGVVVAGTVGPLDEWVDGLVRGSAPSATPEPMAAGIEIPVPASGLIVELREADAGLELRVERGQGALATLSLHGGDDRSRFLWEADRVVVISPGSGPLELRVPEGAGKVRLVWRGASLIAVSGGRIELAGGVVLDELHARLGDLAGAPGPDLPAADPPGSP